MKRLIAFAAATLALAAFAAPAFAARQALNPPAAVLSAWGALKEIDTLAGLPADVRNGNFTAPDGKKLGGWVLAAPGGAWTETDVVTDASLPGRRLHFAGCDATLCVLHYERGGIAHIHLVMTLVRTNGQWKATWIAYGQPAMKDLAELHALLENRSTASYSETYPASINY